MATTTPSVSSRSGRASVDAASSSASPGAQTTKTGRPNQWSASRQRKLARLYLYSILPPNEIRQALEEKVDNWKWMPGKESTTKVVHTLLDKDPRWLRPKNREEMDARIKGLSDSKAQRKHLRRFSPKSYGTTLSPLTEIPNNEAFPTPDSSDFLEDNGSTTVPELDLIAPDEFSETPLQDLLAWAPQEPIAIFPGPSSASFYHSQHTGKASVYANSIHESSHAGHTPSSLNSEDPFAPFMQGTDQVGRLDDQSETTVFDTEDIKRRLSQYSDGYLQNIVRLLEAFSISDGSAATTSRLTPSLDDESTACASTVRPSSSTAASSGNGRGRITLPSAFLFLDRYVRRQGVCLPGLRPHDSGTCWCLEDLNPESPLWVNRTGLSNSRISDPPQNLKHLDLRFRDIFGNTALHMLACRGADITVIFKALKQGADPNAKNSAGQTFAHLFSRQFLRTLAEDKIVLASVLPKLALFNFRFHDCDLFGRSFFHVLTLEARDVASNALEGLKWLDTRNRPARDAFGWTSAIDPTTQAAATAPFQRTYTLAELAKHPHLSSGQNTPKEDDATESADPNYLIFKHARLLETARLAIDVPDIEDTQGRNGLQCLAEASLSLGDEEEVSTANNKRKRDQSDPDPAKTRLAFRYELVQKMIEVGVDVNNYDKKGNTVLMAFITHLQDGEDDKTLTQLLNYIIQNDANLHWRNRDGESALHIAVRLGRKVATRVLLTNGANVHARNSDAKGILAVGEAHYLRAKKDPPLYASIMACMALCIQYGAVARPTLVQEWSIKDRKGE
ncbi:ankyrin [Hyaloscypha variabilis F]|uniref:Ankyrin n=1 Tax=Hyaloscypha variabilis (strain UAMH 11265 / GT02V1 / F) TaxID=1149755 RepID=A0A2J6R8M1_HYAVF|nr:ankyrin [Hyaloscypha variabilis F]